MSETPELLHFKPANSTEGSHGISQENRNDDIGIRLSNDNQIVEESCKT